MVRNQKSIFNASVYRWRIFCISDRLPFQCEVNNMKQTFITITHLDDYMASSFVHPGTTLILKKEPNEYDDEAIAVCSLNGTKYGYAANSSSTVARGTHSAGYIYRDFDRETKCIVRFRLENVAIAELVNETTETEN